MGKRIVSTAKSCHKRPNSRVQVTPLARPVNRGDQEYEFCAVCRGVQESCQRRT